MKVGPVHCNSLLGTAKALGGAKSEQVLEGQAQNAFFQAEFERYRTMAFLSASLPDLPPLLLLFLFMVVALAIWLLSYVLDWLHELELGASNIGTLPLMEDPSSFEKVPFPSLFGPAGKYLSLVMPAYNEQDRIRSTLDETLSYLQERAKKNKSFTYEIIIVDDGSKDNTAKVGFEYVKKYTLDVVRVLKQVVNQGKGAAVRKGMLCSRGQLLLMLDSDGATKITDLEKLESQILQSMPEQQGISTKSLPEQLPDKAVVAFGSRAHLEKQALATRKWYRNLLMKAFHLCVLLVAGPGVRDTQCGFKMFTRSAAQQLFANLRLKRWCFDVELVYLCKRLRIPVHEVAVTWAEIPGSKVHFFSFIHMLFELILVRLGYGFHIWKIHTSIQD
ncbi:hypothetical protein BDL97_05G070000 [Sphagnum fallax]|nr:hypothetical protein BDL97_05G070000 [Sphagnum fallax]